MMKEEQGSSSSSQNTLIRSAVSPQDVPSSTVCVCKVNDHDDLLIQLLASVVFMHTWLWKRRLSEEELDKRKNTFSCLYKKSAEKFFLRACLTTPVVRTSASSSSFSLLVLEQKLQGFCNCCSYDPIWEDSEKRQETQTNSSFPWVLVVFLVTVNDFIEFETWIYLHISTVIDFEVTFDRISHSFSVFCLKSSRG